MRTEKKSNETYKQIMKDEMITNLSPKVNDISLDSKARRPIIIQHSNPSINIEGGYVKQPLPQRIVNFLPKSEFAHSSSTILGKPRLLFFLKLVLNGLIGTLF